MYFNARHNRGPGLCFCKIKTKNHSKRLYLLLYIQDYFLSIVISIYGSKLSITELPLTHLHSKKYVFYRTIEHTLHKNLLSHISSLILLPVDVLEAASSSSLAKRFYESEQFHKSPIISEFTDVMAYATNISHRCECRQWLDS